MALAFAQQLVFHHAYSSSGGGRSNNTLNSKSKINKQQILLHSLHCRNANNAVITAAMKYERVRKEPRQIKWLMQYANQLISRAGFDLDDCKELHRLILEAGFEQDGRMASKLIRMYATCGYLEDARQVFDKITDKQSVSLWNAMINGYARNDLHEEALILYSDMKRLGLLADEVTFSSVIKACAGLHDLERGKYIHVHIIKSGFDSRIYVGNALVNMYAKCWELENACQVLGEMPTRDVVSWSTIISGFVQYGESEVAMEYFFRMLDDGVKPNVLTLGSVLAACTGLEALNWGKEIHARIMKTESESNQIVGTALVGMYAQCKRLEAARRVFNRVPERNLFLWSAMISAYCQNGCSNEALNLFRQLHQNVVKPDLVTIISVLPAFADLASLKHGKEIHCYAIRNKFESDVYLGSALVTMYARCNRLEAAHRVFDRISKRNLDLWNAIISANFLNGCSNEALELFREMHQNALKPDPVTIISILPACGDLASLEHGKEIHCYVIRNKFESDVYVGSALVAMYARCKSLEAARRVFDRISERNLDLWGAIISAYSQNGFSNEALKLFHQMHQNALKPDGSTIGSILPAFDGLTFLKKGKEIHCYAIRNKFESSVYVQNALVAMYGRCERIEAARRVFDRISERDSVLWTTIISAYSQNRCSNEALELFRQMNQNGLKPDPVTIASILPTCGHLAFLKQGKEIHCYVIRNEFESNVYVVSALVAMYARCDRVEAVERVFDRISERSVLTW